MLPSRSYFVLVAAILVKLLVASNKKYYLPTLLATRLMWSNWIACWPTLDIPMIVSRSRNKINCCKRLAVLADPFRLELYQNWLDKRVPSSLVTDSGWRVLMGTMQSLKKKTKQTIKGNLLRVRSIAITVMIHNSGTTVQRLENFTPHIEYT